MTREAGLETSHGQGVAVADLDNDGDLDIYVTGAKPPGQAAGVPPYDENSLSRAADRVDWARRMHKKGYLTKNQLNQEVAQYQALKAQIDADIARAADRVDWAKRMFEKGYLSKAQYEAELLKHYAALKARLGGQTPATSNIEVLERYLKELQSVPPAPNAAKQSGTPKSPPADLTAPNKPARKAAPANPDASSKPAPKEPPADPTAPNEAALKEPPADPTAPDKPAPNAAPRTRQTPDPDSPSPKQAPDLDDNTDELVRRYSPPK